jgi:hypothetical protein
MLYNNTLNEIENNINTGVEYEIALFAKLIEKNNTDFPKVINSIKNALIYGKRKMENALYAE